MSPMPPFGQRVFPTCPKCNNECRIICDNDCGTFRCVCGCEFHLDPSTNAVHFGHSPTCGTCRHTLFNGHRVVSN